MNKTPKKTRMPSPARSHSAMFSPRRHSSRRSSERSSVGSPGRPKSAGVIRLSSSRLSSNFNTVTLLSDNTDISRRQKEGSWWKLVNDHSPTTKEMLEGRGDFASENAMAHIPSDEVESESKSRSDENPNFELTSEGSGDNISLTSSLNNKKKKLFKKRETVEGNKMALFKNIMQKHRYSEQNSAKSGIGISDDEKTMNIRKKTFFTRKTEVRDFPIEVSNDNTQVDALTEVRKKSVFSKRKTVKPIEFEQFMLDSSEAEQEEHLIDTDIQKGKRESRAAIEHKQIESSINPSEIERTKRQPSPANSNVSETNEFDGWRMLPSSTMIDNMDGLSSEKGTPIKKTVQKMLRDNLLHDLDHFEENVGTPQIEYENNQRTSNVKEPALTIENTTHKNESLKKGNLEELTHQDLDNRETTQNKRQSNNKNMEKLGPMKNTLEISPEKLFSPEQNTEKRGEEEQDALRSIREQRAERLSKNISLYIQNDNVEPNNVNAQNIATTDHQVAQPFEHNEHDYSLPQKQTDITENTRGGKSLIEMIASKIVFETPDPQSQNESSRSPTSNADQSPSRNLSTRDRSLRKRKLSLSHSRSEENENSSISFNSSQRKFLRLSKEKQKSTSINHSKTIASPQINSIHNESVLSSEKENVTNETTFDTIVDNEDGTKEEHTIRESLVNAPTNRIVRKSNPEMGSEHYKLIETAPETDNGNDQLTNILKLSLPKSADITEQPFTKSSGPRIVGKKVVVFRSSEVTPRNDVSETEETEHENQTILVHGARSSFRQDFSSINAMTQKLLTKKRLSRTTDDTNDNQETTSESSNVTSGNKMARKRGRPRKNEMSNTEFREELERKIQDQTTDKHGTIKVAGKRGRPKKDNLPNLKLAEESVNIEQHKEPPPQKRKLVSFLSDEPVSLSQRKVNDKETSQPREKTVLEKYLDTIKEKNLLKKQKIEEAVLESLKPANYTENKTKMPFILRKKPTTIKAKKKQTQLIVDGEVYRTPKMFKPKAWVTQRLYKFLESKLQPKYNLSSRVKAEKFVKLLSDTYSRVLGRDKKHPQQLVKQLVDEMARLKVIHTHFDFYNFVYDFFPMEFRIAVVPDLDNGLPLPPEGVYAPILNTD